MHEYAILHHDRANIGRWLGFSAIIVAGFLTNLIDKAYSATGWNVFLSPITVGIVYFGLHYLFNRWGWMIPFFKVPNIEGIWLVEGETLKKNGDIEFNWNAEIDIEQSWKNISITSKTKNSTSVSYTATLSKQSGSKSTWRLSYSYSNQPKENKIHELNAHQGYCEIEFDNNLENGNANYFNSGSRRTFGTMKLRKQQDD